MSETLSVIANQRKLGSLTYADDKLTFHYDISWIEWEGSFPLSVSLPFKKNNHSHHAIENYLWGLLPDNRDILEEYGRQFHVSPRNVFRLLSHVGQDCPGAIQFISEKHEEKLLKQSYLEQVEPLTEEQLDELILSIRTNNGIQRTSADQGQFSLAGAQPKTALHRSPNGVWGIPNGLTPTTHILKPALGEFVGFAENEHFCLHLAGAVGLPVAPSEIIHCADIPVIVVERYDRFIYNNRYYRIHQEDFCQALSIHPKSKYECEGGPSIVKIAEVIWDNNNNAYQDIVKFADAIMLNFLIVGSDAHAKNYSLLLAGGRNNALSPFYDIISFLPYPAYNPHKQKMAMKIGSDYKMKSIHLRNWKAMAKQIRLPEKKLITRFEELTDLVRKAAPVIAEDLKNSGLKHPIVETLAKAISERTEAIQKLYFK